MDRQKNLDVALGQIEKQFGKGSVMRLGDETRAPLEVIPTGSVALDLALLAVGLDAMRQLRSQIVVPADRLARLVEQDRTDSTSVRP